MNIVLLGHQDIASVYALDCLIRTSPKHEFTVFWSGSMASRKDSAPTLEALEATDRSLFERYIERSETPDQLREATALSAPNGPTGLETLETIAPDLVVSIRYRRILKDEAIAIPTHGVLNLHSGILPDYRGVMATFWAMLAGEREIGTTLHRIVDAGIDTGPVIASTRRATDYSRSYLSNVLSLYEQACKRIARAIEAVEEKGVVDAVDQPGGGGNYYGAPSEADALLFTAKGLELANGNECHDLRTFVRNL